ncbi:hypothetical protein AMATHDRAFT_8078 [Amanita thiersii Skay4041]|uniref:Fungal-type protein kinase domain-containing protein n=1 Tax=Amanita thiersii Skay4041 TaxID=703135 RepID=A0A2A9NEZ0_9AGAR|nr:hypothetical protein AMATHDRAFT_8078 [Amanita thiersii Skay4041]
MTSKNLLTRLSNLEDESCITTWAQDHSQIYYTTTDAFVFFGKPDDVEFKLPPSMHASNITHIMRMLKDITRTICCDASGSHRYQQLNRVHSRTTLYPVGVPLVQFPSTKHLVSALRDAIKGHQAFSECGLLLRDISPHNIFLFTSDDGDSTPNSGHLRSHIPEDLWDMTGTYQFMALEILKQQTHECKDDLESFIRVLFWLVLRHMDYHGTEMTCAEVFDELDLTKVSNAKHCFLRDQVKYNRYVRVRQNRPLSMLLRELVERVLGIHPLGISMFSLYSNQL